MERIIRNQMFDAHGLSKDLRDVAIPEAEPEVHPLDHDFPCQLRDVTANKFSDTLSSFRFSFTSMMNMD